MPSPFCIRKIAVILSLAGCTLLAALPASAQDDRGALPGNTRTRSSPFDPPTEDVFVADDGPGLDTGCTFNTDSNHPLMIDIEIDQAVGEVNSSGYLVDPAALVADGVVPATVSVVIPAYDVDLNGSPPPESDEVLLNGERLGTLTGDNGIWKLNSFSIPISKIKFPAPLDSGSPAPVANRVQINVDTLSSGRWCTAIDWVALRIPIKLRAAFTLEPDGNEIRVRDYASNDTIDTIYKQSFDASCNLTNDIDAYAEYPFSGPAKSLFGLLTGSATLHATLERCPRNDELIPEVKVHWEIAGTPLQGVANWSGSDGDIDLTMPDKVGSYDVALIFAIDGKEYPAVHRKLFVTWRSVYSLFGDPPRLGWYEKATAWAAGQGNEDSILASLLSNLYSFGGSHWRYIDSFNCKWKDLVKDDPIACHYANCYVFSDVLENMAATLGVGSLSSEKQEGAHKRGFITNGTPSLDPAFPGNAKRVGSSTYDRYAFASHSLLLKNSKYYDATFQGIYSSSTAFITANLNGRANSDTDGPYMETDEGWNVYERPGVSFYTWPDLEYKAPPPPPPPGPAPVIQGLISPLKSGPTGIAFTGNATFEPVDDDLDGIAEALGAEVEVQINAGGQYTILGALQKGGQLIANRPSWESTLPVRASLDEISGTYTVTLKFSGEQIDRSGLDGPYDLVLEGIGATGFTSTTLATPSYAHTLFGENPARLAGVSEVAVDGNGDGKYEGIDVTVDLGVRLPGELRLQGALEKDGQTLVDAGMTQTLAAGARQVVLRFDGRKIRRSGLDGPYQGSVNLIDATGHTIEGITLTTRPYAASSFAGLLEPQGPFSDQGVDSNGNGLFDLLRIGFGAEIDQAGSYRVTGVLHGASSPVAVYTHTLLTLPAGSTNVSLDFSGPAINALGLNGPYTVELLLRDPSTAEELDGVRLPQATASYQSTQFDPFGATGQPIVLTGHSSDSGVDTNGNGRYDELHVDIEVSLARADFYQWSAGLVDRNGTEIGFSTSQASLNAGVTNLHFVFDSQAIAGNGVDGPYFVKGLLVFGSSGANLVRLDVAETRPYRSTDFDALDLLPPHLEVSTALTVLPANHKHKAMGVTHFVVRITDNLDPSVSLKDVVITQVTSDEPDDAPGSNDGETVDDIVIAPDCRSVKLRGERAGIPRGSGNGRVYTIHVAAADASGNVGTASYTVIVPASGTSAVDDGPAYSVKGCTLK